MKSTIQYITLSSLAVIMMLSACKKMVTVDPPRNQVVTEQVFADSANATSAILGIYTRIMNSTTFSFGNGSATRFAGLVADELTLNRNNANEREFATNSISVDNSLNADFWKDGYRIIYQTNACIEGISNSTGISPTLKKHLTGEALIARSYVYFYLVNFYGDIPLILSTDFQVNAIEPRSATSLVMKKITEDLDEAQTSLPDNYMGGNKVRANKHAAMALLARTHLYLQNWSKAEELSTKLIGSGIYSLLADPARIFLNGSSEAIWCLPPLRLGYETAEGFNFVPTSTSSLPGYEVSQLLLNAFPANDLRKTSWFGKNRVSGVDRYYPYKYKLGYTGLTEPKEYYTLFRLGEQYLVRAEARLNQQDLDGCLADLNEVRYRAGLNEFISTDIGEIRTELELQRRLELCLEPGHRFFDLKRTGRIDAVLEPVKAPNWQTTDKLFPVPATELRLNYFLHQNPGY